MAAKAIGALLVPGLAASADGTPGLPARTATPSAASTHFSLIDSGPMSRPKRDTNLAAPY